MRVQHLAFALSILSALVTAQSKYRNPAMGVEFDTPARWKQTPYVPDGRGVFAQFRCYRSYASRTSDAFPKLQVIEFTAVAQDEPKDSDPTKAAYRDYEHYLQRNHPDFEVIETKNRTIAKTSCKRYEVRSGETLRIAVVYQDKDRKVAVEFEVLEAIAERIKIEVNHSFATFRFTSRTAKKPAATRKSSKREGREWDIDRKKWRARPLRERHQIRSELEAQLWAEAKAAAQGSWKISEKNGYLLISNVDRRFAQRVLSAAVAFRKICDTVFDSISDEYARHRVLRVQESDEGYRSNRFSSFNSGFELNDERMIIVKKIDGNSVAELGSLYSEILDLYLQDKDVYFHRYMPKWFNDALHNYVSQAFPKNRKLEFRKESSEREALAELKREGKLLTVAELLNLSDEDYDSLLDDDRRIEHQATAFVRYAFGRGKKSKLTKSFLSTYPAAIIAVAERHSKTWDDEADIASMLKEDRERYKKDLAEGKIEPPVASDTPKKKADPAETKRRHRRRLWQRRRAAISKEVAAEAFSFSKKQWKALNKAFLASVK